MLLLPFCGNTQKNSLIIKLKENAPVTAYVYLNQGSDLIPVDSIMLGRGIFAFKTTKYKPGIYSFVLSEDMYARFIVNNEDIEIATSLESLTDSLKIIKSEENKVYYSFLRERERYNKKMEAISTLLRYYSKKGKLNRALIKEQKNLDISYNNTIRGLINSKGDLLASKIILAELPVHAPDNLPAEEKHQFLIANWWSSFPFECPYIINTPSITDKLWDYIDLYYVDGASRDEQTTYFERAVDEVMNQPGISEEVMAFFKKEMVKTFSQSSYDKIIEYIEKNYPLNSEHMSSYIDTEFDKLLSLTSGKAAPDFIIEADGKKGNLYQMKNNGTVLIFWSMDCSHCRKMLPEFTKNYKAIQKMGFDIVAINLDAYRPAWKAYIKENNFAWVNMNIQNPFNSPITSAYNVTGTPVIYILDKDKRIYDKPADASSTLKSLEKLYKEK